MKDNEELWYEEARHKMVKEQIIDAGIKDDRIIAAMKKVPRHIFVPRSLRRYAYDDRPLPIGHDQTISQPFIVAYTIQEAEVGPDDHVLDIGTGSGYQAALLNYICREVYTIEVVKPLVEKAREVFTYLECDKIVLLEGDGWKGVPEYAPYHAILSAAAPKTVPFSWLEQLKMGGRLVTPIGSREAQILIKIKRTPKEFQKTELMPVRFVPLVEFPPS